MKGKIFIVPENDLESKAIIELLKRNGYEEGIDLFITKQGWGASWDNLEPEIKEVLEKNDSLMKMEQVEVEDSSPLTLDSKGSWETGIWRENGYHPNPKDSHKFTHHGTYREYLEDSLEDYIKTNPEVNSHQKTCFRRDKIIVPKRCHAGLPVYGIELQGKTPYALAGNIDHHVYDGDNRENIHASIEQVAYIIDTKLTLEEKFIAANDRGHISEMKSLINKLIMDAGIGEQMIQHIRLLDRKAQGITEEHEKQAEEALKSIDSSNPKLTIIHLPHSKCATITDRLYGEYENLLIISKDGEINFFGKGEICKELQREFAGWSGGDLSTSGFWGGYADPKTVKEFIQKELALGKIEVGTQAPEPKQKGFLKSMAERIAEACDWADKHNSEIPKTPNKSKDKDIAD